MDAGKVAIKIRADLMDLEALRTLADKLQIALQRAGLDSVTERFEVPYEPFTAESPDYGHKWNQITVDLSRPTDLQKTLDLFISAGIPHTSHVTCTDHMRMCGVTLSRR